MNYLLSPHQLAPPPQISIMQKYMKKGSFDLDGVISYNDMRGFLQHFVFLLNVLDECNKHQRLECKHGNFANDVYLYKSYNHFSNEPSGVAKVCGALSEVEGLGPVSFSVGGPISPGALSGSP